MARAHTRPRVSGKHGDLSGIAVDLLAIAGLVGVRAGIPKALFWIAVIAGIGLFAIRLNSTASWWTGHLMYSVREYGSVLI